MICWITWVDCKHYGKNQYEKKSNRFIDQSIDIFFLIFYLVVKKLKSLKSNLGMTEEKHKDFMKKHATST